MEEAKQIALWRSYQKAKKTIFSNVSHLTSIHIFSTEQCASFNVCYIFLVSFV